MRISAMDDEQAAATLLKAYRRICDAYDPAEHGKHPSHTINEWLRASVTGSAPGSSERQIEPADDDVQPSLSAAGNNGRGGKVPAQDGQFCFDTANVPRFVTSTGAVLTGDAAHAAHARQSDPARVRRQAAAIRGYDRLR